MNEYFDMAKLGRNISTARKTKNYTQGRLAEELGVSHQAISSWENGLTSPDIGNLKELSRIFDVTIDELMDNKLMSAAMQKVDKQEALNQEEFLSVAPILPPKEIEEVLDHQDVRFDFSAIVELLPYLESETLTEWVKAEQAPHHLSDLSPLFPFLDEEGLNVLIERYPINVDSAQALFPFLEEAQIESIAHIELESKTLREVASLFPFMDEKKIDEMVYALAMNKRADAKAITSAAPFMSEQGIKRVMKLLIEQNSEVSVAELLPYLDD